MVRRNIWLWGIQVSVAIISLAETLLLTYLGYKVGSCLLLRITGNGQFTPTTPTRLNSTGGDIRRLSPTVVDS